MSEAEVEALLAQLRAEFADELAFETALVRLALTRAELHENLRRQLLVRDYVDSRFRETVEVSDDAAERYWQEVLAPDMREQGVVVPELESVKEDFVIPILQEQEVNRRVQSWIGDLRDRATIRRMYP